MDKGIPIIVHNPVGEFADNLNCRHAGSTPLLATMSGVGEFADNLNCRHHSRHLRHHWTQQCNQSQPAANPQPSFSRREW
jgi:hypothetical protein